MQNLGKVTTKVKTGGGLNVLCLSMAGYLIVDTIIRLDKWIEHRKEAERLEQACEAVKNIKEVWDKIDAKYVKEETTEEAQ